ncbi:MAG: hypothetical protein V2A76_01005, partial [Planctomycetota bacterium]
SCVPPADPKTPVGQRPSTWWAAAILVFGLTLGGIDTLLKRQANDAVSEALTVEQQRDRLKAERSRLIEENAERERLLAALAAAEKRTASLVMRVHCWREEVPRRAGFLPEILDALVVAVNGSVFIDSVKEVRPYVIEIEGGRSRTRPDRNSPMPWRTAWGARTCAFSSNPCATEAMSRVTSTRCGSCSVRKGRSSNDLPRTEPA